MQPQIPNAKPEMSAKEKILAAYSVKLGIKMPTENEINKEFNPILDALNKKIKSLSGNLEQTNPLFSPSKLTLLTRAISGLFKGGEDAKKGILGLTDALGEKMGLGKAWASNTASMLNYAMMSKNVKAANKELYESMGPVGKAITSLLSGMGGNGKMFEDINKLNEATSGKKQTDSDKQIEGQKNSVQSLKDLMESTMERKKNLLSDSIITNKNVDSKIIPSEQIAASTNGMTKLAEASEVAGAEGTEALAAVGMEAVIASGGILLIVGAVVALGAAFYKCMSIVVSLRMEMKKFDQVFMGIGEGALKELQGQLFNLNEGMKDLGISMEKVNGVVLAAMASGVSVARAMSAQFNATVQELSGVIGVEVGQLGNFFTELIKKIRLSDASIHNFGNSLVTYNKVIYESKYKDLGAISFTQLSEAIQTSTNALMIAQHAGDSFAKAMMADLTALTGMAVNLGMSISELNGKFEESGSLLSSATSGFRDLLVISGGASMNNLMTNQFNKTESMLKMATYLQDLNTKFGNNINLTAQVAQQTWGLSKEASMQLLLMTESQKEHIREMKKLLVNLDENNVAEAYKNVTHNLVDAWEQVKASVMNVFERAIGRGGGMDRLNRTLTNVVEKIKDMINGPTFTKIMTFFNKLFDSAGDFLGNIVEKVDGLLEKMLNTKGGFWAAVGTGLKEIFSGLGDILVEMLSPSMETLGKMFANGIMMGIPGGFAMKWIAGLADDSSKSSINDENKQMAQLSSLGVTLQQEIRNLNATVRKDQELLDGLKSVGAKGGDLTFGKDSDGNAGFMTVAEKQYLLQKEIDEANRKKEEDEKILQQEQTNLLRQIRDGVTKQHSNSIGESVKDAAKGAAIGVASFLIFG